MISPRVMSFLYPGKYSTQVLSNGIIKQEARRNIGKKSIDRKTSMVQDARR
jgi:hypothetical protein